MSKTFEELLDGRKLHELTDSEIDEIVQQMNPEELEKLDKAVKKDSSKKKKRPPTRKQQQNMDDFNKALFGGEEQ